MTLLNETAGRLGALQGRTADAEYPIIRFAAMRLLRSALPSCPYDLRKLAHSSFSFSSEVVLSRAQANTVRHDRNRELREPNNGII